MAVPTNLITDTSFPADVKLTTPAGDAITFTMNGSPDPNAQGSNSFNLLGCMCGPATFDDGSGPAPNVGGLTIVTLSSTYAIGSPLGDNPPVVIATGTVDLTNATPGQMVWCNDVITTFTLNAYDYYGQLVYTINVATPDNPDYVFYSWRPCVVRLGLNWSAGGLGSYDPNTQTIGVDCNLVNFDDLGGVLTPDVTLNSFLLRRGELRPKQLQPQVKLGGSPRIAGALEGSLATDIILANAAGMVSGPLWKPAILCTG
jgi:hypothetical protein